jgi:hypothetical protein
MKFPNILYLSEEEKKLIIDVSNKQNKNTSLKLRSNFFETINLAWKKDPNSTLRKLDEVWFNILNIPLETLDALYSNILAELSQYD